MRFCGATRKETVMASDNNTSTTADNGEAKRGRKPGQKVVSLDFRAFMALDDIDFASKLSEGDAGSRAWHKRIITDIIGTLRDAEVF
jgi:hypothetical protein